MSVKIEVTVDESDINHMNARSVIKEIMNKTDEVEAAAVKLADKFGIQFSTGDYGNGRTYYPKGTPGHEVSYYDEHETDSEGRLIEGVWISSSDQC